MRHVFALCLLAALAPLPAAAQGGSPDPLTEAVLYQDPEQVAALLAKGADPNTVFNGRSALGWAAQADSLDIVQRLVAAGAGLDAVDGVGHTPLMRAAETRKLEIVRFLIEKGADVNAADGEGNTILLKAVEDSYTEILPVLLAAKADPNRADADGRTPLMSAVQYRYTAMVPMLAAAGADLNAPTVLGPPLFIALDDGDRDLIAALLAAGADPNVKSEYAPPPSSERSRGGSPPRSWPC